MKIALIGTGNVATHIANRIIELNLDLFGVLGSSTVKTQLFSEKTGIKALKDYSELSKADLAIVCVQDNKLETTLKETLEFCNCVTTSGTFDITRLPKMNFEAGVFYPLQSFAADTEVDFSKIPFFIEAADRLFEKELLQLGNQLGKEAVIFNASDRINLHITAVFLNNFSNHICALGNEFAQSKGIDFSWFEALIDETFRKIKRGASFKDQTGPAQRGDTETMQKHLQLLDEMKAKIYSTISESIQQKNQTHDQL